MFVFWGMYAFAPYLENIASFTNTLFVCEFDVRLAFTQCQTSDNIPHVLGNVADIFDVLKCSICFAALRLCPSFVRKPAEFTKRRYYA